MQVKDCIRIRDTYIRIFFCDESYTLKSLSYIVDILVTSCKWNVQPIVLQLMFAVVFGSNCTVGATPRWDVCMWGLGFLAKLSPEDEWAQLCGFREHQLRFPVQRGGLQLQLKRKIEGDRRGWSLAVVATGNCGHRAFFADYCPNPISLLIKIKVFESTWVSSNGFESSIW